jgi:hypothetical protein
MRHVPDNPLGLFDRVTIGRAQFEYDSAFGAERRVFAYAASENNVEPQLPASGSFTYRGPVIGHGIGTNSRRAYDLVGTITLEVDFGAREITGALEFSGFDREQAFSVDLGRLPFESYRFDVTGAWSAEIEGAGGTGIGDIRGVFNAVDVTEGFGAFEFELQDPSNPASTLRAAAAYIAQQE